MREPEAQTPEQAGRERLASVAGRYNLRLEKVEYSADTNTWVVELWSGERIHGPGIDNLLSVLEARGQMYNRVGVPGYLR